MTEKFISIMSADRDDAGATAVEYGLMVALIAVAIIATVTAPLTWESVGLLGVIVLIRTFLSFSLETEIEGVWPWQRRARAGGAQERR